VYFTNKIFEHKLDDLLFSVIVPGREKIGYYDSVNIIKPEDAAILFKAEGHYPKRLTVEAWTSYRDYRNRKYGVLLKYAHCSVISVKQLFK
jgi:hypothetical protein